VRLTKCAKQTIVKCYNQNRLLFEQGIGGPPSIKQNKNFHSAIGRSGAHRRKLRTTFCLSATFGLRALWPSSHFGLNGYGNKASGNLRGFSPVFTFPLVIAFVFVAKQSAY
jgi:hypothetical protein